MPVLIFLTPGTYSVSCVKPVGYEDINGPTSVVNAEVMDKKKHHTLSQAHSRTSAQETPRTQAYMYVLYISPKMVSCVYAPSLTYGQAGTFSVRI